MTESENQYKDWRGLESAIQQGARHAAAAAGSSSSASVSDRRSHAIYDRFLSRVFSDGAESGWLLKGGMAMLARVPDARRTKDLDLTVSGLELDEAVRDLEQRAAREFGDHLQFTIVKQRQNSAAEQQPYRDARQVHFVARVGARKVADIKVDVVVAPAPIGEVEVVEPSERLALSRALPDSPYRLYPLVDQLADKVCATMSTYGAANLRSTRVKDLVDLVIAASTQTVNQRQLQLAIATERVRRRLPDEAVFEIPEHWEQPYERLAAVTAAVNEYGTMKSARALVDEFLAPALGQDRVAPDLEWQPRLVADASEGTGWVRPHMRRSGPVRGYQRGDSL